VVLAGTGKFFSIDKRRNLLVEKGAMSKLGVFEGKFLNHPERGDYPAA